MRLSPFDDMPLPLTPEAEQDKRIWSVAISTMKGKERQQSIAQFVNRYKEMPRIPDSMLPKFLRQEYQREQQERWKRDSEGFI
jgi:hypothetical protein